MPTECTLVLFVENIVQVYVVVVVTVTSHGWSNNFRCVTTVFGIVGSSIVVLLRTVRY